MTELTTVYRDVVEEVDLDAQALFILITTTIIALLLLGLGVSSVLNINISNTTLEDILKSIDLIISYIVKWILNLLSTPEL